ncbi:MFS transporter [Amycolatopsis pithecellobii]|uniref:MFS transporter n=1 Tax=Amycolatopsis pithecellobii TaxID=664692 RepID=A0A6N7Z3L0_9PSEU|nr:MFS transporter [Amycolatopsis pithecellobii]MTD54664.1 MFS transporter [Amycolatopsis pithecellobii]
MNGNESPAVSVPAPPASARHTPAAKRARKAALAAFLGGTLEYYDFGIFLTASSLVFSHIMFGGDGSSAILLSLATFGVAYVARPLGGIVLGHLGDRYGRKRVLLATVVLMGTSTFLIGCLPTFATAGVWAPILLVALRLLQGVSAGGEIAGSSVLVVEHAPARRRGVFGSWAINGPNAGFVVAGLVFIGVAGMPHAALLAWGWRIPFWLSLFVLGVAYFFRRSIEEPEVFVEQVEAADRGSDQAIPRLPLWELLRHQAPAVLRVAACALFTTVNTMVSVFALTFATGPMRLPSSLMLAVSILINTIAIGLQPLAGILSDRFGRRPVMLVGCLGCMAGIFGYLDAISAASPVAIFIAVIGLTLFYTMANGVYPAFFVEMFETRVRYTGTAVGLQISQLVAGFAPVVALALAGGDTRNWIPAAVLTAALCAVSVVAIFFARETFRRTL